MSQYDLKDYVIVNLAYLIISGIVIPFHLVVFPVYFKQTFLKCISLKYGRHLFCSWIILTLGISFFVFKISFGYYDLTIERIITGLLAFGALAIFPLLVVSFIDRDSEKAGRVENTIMDTSVGKINIAATLYVYSDRNYIIYVDLSGNEKKVRGSLKSVRNQLLSEGGFIQTHRAYLVNISKVNKVNKSNNAYSLDLFEHDREIPLSRSFYTSFQKAFSP